MSVKTFYRGFNGLRAAAVTLVFVTHKARIESFDTGKLGVWIFFVISGFLIIGELREAKINLETKGGLASVVFGEFFRRRSVRIFPIYYLLLLLILIGHVAVGFPKETPGIAWHFAYLSNFWMVFVNQDWAGPFTHFWSLAVEQQFYLIIPFVMIAVPSRFHGPFLTGLILCGIAGHFLMVEAYSSGMAELTVSPLNASLLAAGGLIYLKRRDLPVVNNLWLWVALLVMCVCAGMKSIMDETPGVAMLRDVGQLVATAVLIMYVVKFQTSTLVNMLELKFISYIGIVSYGFYLFHNFIPNPLGPAFKIIFHTEPSAYAQFTIGVAINYLLVLAVAAVSWEFIEKPIIRAYKNKKPKAIVSTQGLDKESYSNG